MTSRTQPATTRRKTTPKKEEVTAAPTPQLSGSEAPSARVIFTREEVQAARRAAHTEIDQLLDLFPGALGEVLIARGAFQLTADVSRGLADAGHERGFRRLAMVFLRLDVWAVRAMNIDPATEELCDREALHDPVFTLAQHAGNARDVAVRFAEEVRLKTVEFMVGSSRCWDPSMMAAWIPEPHEAYQEVPDEHFAWWRTPPAEDAPAVAAFAGRCSPADRAMVMAGLERMRLRLLPSTAPEVQVGRPKKRTQDATTMLSAPPPFPDASPEHAIYMALKNAHPDILGKAEFGMACRAIAAEPENESKDDYWTQLASMLKKAGHRWIEVLGRGRGRVRQYCPAHDPWLTEDQRAMYAGAARRIEAMKKQTTQTTQTMEDSGSSS